MNDQFGGFDLNSFGLDFTPQQVQQQQVRQQQAHQQGYLSNHGNTNGINSSTNGPCMDNYDPNQVLMSSMHTPQYNPMATVGGQHPRGSNTSSRINENDVMGSNHNRHRQSHTHQILMPANIPPSSRRTSSSSQNTCNHQSQQHSNQSQQQMHQHHLQTGFPDFEPMPIQKRGGGGRASTGRGVQQLQCSSQIPNNNNSSNDSLTSCLRGTAQLSYQQQQQQQQPYHMSDRSNRATKEVSTSVTNFFSMPSSSPPQQNNQVKQQQRQKQKQERPPKQMREEWLEKLQVKVSGVSLKPIPGSEIIQLLKQRSNEVLTRYLPCVDFLVQCQQELRKGLQVATTKRYVNHMFRDTLTPRQFHTQYISQLPERFYRKNRRIMTNANVTTAYKELETLVANAKGAENQGCEVVKNTFLGGMKDGESWGLRKWLSKQGGALHICNDTECLSTSCQKLERELESTRKLAERLRPLAAAALKKLKSEIPSSYQEQSSAHPYLPFFHRLECALRGMSNFDPEDDDVICIIDDDEVEELKAKASSAPPSSKRKRSRTHMSESSDVGNKTKRASGSSSHLSKDKFRERLVSTFNEDDDSDIEVLERKPPPKRSMSKKSVANENSVDANESVNHFSLAGTVDDEDESDIMQAILKTLDDDNNEDPMNFDYFEQKSDADEVDINGGNHTSNVSNFNAVDLADGLDSLASLFDSNQHDTVRPNDIEKESFWDDRLQYASALRLFSEILRAPDCTSMFLESIDEDELIQEGKLPYTEIVKHPLCFRDIASALLQDFNRVQNSIECSNGILPCGTMLQDWNMWKGMELLQAIDLVFLNSLAYGKANDGFGKTNVRSRTNKLRKLFWTGIKDVIDDTLSSCDAEERRKCTPTRRGESSGFVVKKDSL